MGLVRHGLPLIDSEHGKEHAAKRSSGSGSGRGGSGSGGGIGGGGHPILRELALVEMGKRRRETKKREEQKRTEKDREEENRVETH